MNRGLINLLGIGRATMIDDTGDLQMVQVTEGATGTGGHDLVTDKVARVTEFGFTSVPPISSVVTLLRRCGERSRSIIFGSSHTDSRPKGLKPGDTVVYDVRGAKVSLTADGLLIDCAGLPAIVRNATTIALRATQKVTIDAPTAEVLHDLTVAGTIHADGRISTDTDVSVDGHLFTTLRQAYGVHKHTGVKGGADTSAGPDTAA